MPTESYTARNRRSIAPLLEIQEHLPHAGERHTAQGPGGFQWRYPNPTKRDEAHDRDRHLRFIEDENEKGALREVLDGMPIQDGLNVTIKALLGESDRHTRQPLRLINDAANERGASRPVSLAIPRWLSD